MTLHKLLYDSIPRPGGGFFRKPKLNLDYTIVVVDEVSMAPKSIMDKYSVKLNKRAFKDIDNIASNLQIPKDDDRRLSALIIYIITNICF